MGERSKIVTMLPKRLRESLDQKLIDGSFSHYRELEGWLADQGFAISRSAIQRYGSEFEQRVQAIALASSQAEAIAKAAPDRANSMTDALTRLVQERLFGLLVETENLSEKDLPRYARAIADLARASIAQKRWSEEMTERLRAQKHAAAERIAAEETTGGLSPEAAETIRSILLGIDPLNVKGPFAERGAESVR